MDEFDEDARLNQQQTRLIRRHIDFLRTRSPDDWHRYADDVSWDERLDVLYWIASQPQCDRATATMLFWKGEPTGWDWEEDDSVMGDDEYAVEPLLKYIAIRFNTTGYPRAEIAYDFLEVIGYDAASPYAAAITDGRLGDFAILRERQKDFDDPLVKLHPDLAVLRVPGRKVGGPGDTSDFYDLLPSGDED